MNPTKGAPLTVLEKHYGAKFSSVSSLETITQHMAGGGDGARGIVLGSYGRGQPGHVLKVVNKNGVI
ncbi:toxin glutamine deamidase domain-containing protein [Pseudomonas syringae]|uniref:toxin glutamine deamidase domain-containing protein n=1 Tax=Pseudomonas TaxID=286 RepID=UPI0034E98840